VQGDADEKVKVGCAQDTAVAMQAIAAAIMIFFMKGTEFVMSHIKRPA
jgi:hypothetical protein